MYYNPSILLLTPTSNARKPCALSKLTFLTNVPVKSSVGSNMLPFSMQVPKGI